ncbi:hypothetical protein Q5H92_08920 [Hymenobacter sp. M29]|uniref:Uncharacterized protein n=1 Tax=Hymenobacter mellowenesis TaxID=3063995 RepID=A0ABT9A9F7_9BACT|nr:hypothetical protein [Hymenobacter sp. M29]MDO7846477.1 hypothetical protein [Hymenobacter sp. M29]
MPAPSPIRDILEAIGLAICREMVRLLDETGRYPLRANSTLKRQLLSGEAVKVKQGRGSSGRFEGFTANASIELYALDYLQWVDSGRRPGGKKVPLSAILKFIKDRGLQYRDKTTGRFARSRVRLKGRDGSPAQSVNRLAFMIQNAIYRRGIRARPVIGPAFDLGAHLVELYLDSQFLDGLTYDLEQQLDLIFTSSK